MGITEACGCGTCAPCRRNAGVRIAVYARKQRRTRRWGRDEYVRSQTKLLLMMVGLMEEEDGTAEELRRSEWGAAMRKLREETEGA